MIRSIQTSKGRDSQRVDIMKRKNLTGVLLLCGATLIPLARTAGAQDRTPPRSRGLDLTEEQRTRMRELRSSMMDVLTDEQKERISAVQDRRIRRGARAFERGTAGGAVHRRAVRVRDNRGARRVETRLRRGAIQLRREAMQIRRLRSRAAVGGFGPGLDLTDDQREKIREVLDEEQRERFDRMNQLRSRNNHRGAP